MQKDYAKPKHRDKIEALDNLSLGISIIVAILIGVGVGIGLKNITGISWTLWIGVFWGISAAILNIYKAYKRAQKSLEELANDPKYQHRAKYGG
jgi:F0F1-type ATP synthase assembly protein I